jgi:hypothetical protein
VIIVVSCPRCKSTRCHPTFYTAYSYGCIPCGHEFDLRGGFWRKFKAYLAWLFEKPELPVLSEEEQIEREWWDEIK